MSTKEKSGFINLAKKTMAVITGSISVLAGVKAKATETVIAAIPDATSISVNFKKELKPQFTLRLNSNLERSMLFMHVSHSSHSSHRSHASHASHASHYSGSPTYSPPAPVRPAPPATPASTTTTTTTTTRTATLPVKRSETIRSTIKTSGTYSGTSGLSISAVDVLGYYYRELYKGCEGFDVEYLQQLLVAAGYTTPTTGYFGDKTEAAVLKFQKENELKPDGKVKEKTYTYLKNKVDEI